MNKDKNSSVLVIFTKDLPKKGIKWWRQFDIVVAPKQLEITIQQRNLSFVDIESLIDPGNVQEASELARKLSLLTVLDGRRLSKIVNYKGYELWWIHYDDIYYKFCLPFTQYHALLAYLKSFEAVYLYKPPVAGLFTYFLEAYQCNYELFDDSRSLSLGFLLQVSLSLPFLLWLIIRRPGLMIWTSDQFDPPRDHDFRLRFIYEELRRKKIYFVEFIRSMEQTPTVLQHALLRRRATVYSFAIVNLIHYIAGWFGPMPIAGLSDTNPVAKTNPEGVFWFLVATHFLRDIRGDLWSIWTMQLVLRCVGVRVAIIDSATGRSFHEMMACKLLNIPVIGILHGVPSKFYPVYDFMPEFDGEKQLSVDKYGLWSEWWKEYYLKNSRAYKPEQLYISGPMRPLEHADIPALSAAGHSLKVLFLSEQLAAPTEILPYLEVLMEAKDISLHFKFRPYRDGFEEWLKANRPDILERMDIAKVMRGTIGEAIARCDVIVGSHTGGVLEALLYLRPMVFFHTKKWGDYFELESFNLGHSFIAKNPQELLVLIRKSRSIPRKILEELQRRFFGDPYMNGSKWVVEQVEEFL